MRTFIWYIKSIFCNHEWKYEEKKCEQYDYVNGTNRGTKVSATCKKCGWHRSYWKFLD